MPSTVAGQGLYPEDPKTIISAALDRVNETDIKYTVFTFSYTYN